MLKSEEDEYGYTKEERELSYTAKTGEDMDRHAQLRKERRRREWEEQVKEKWMSTQAGQMFTKLAETYAACQKLVEQHPYIPEIAQVVDGERPDVFTMLRDNLEKANRAPRCEYPKSNGQFCWAPKMRGEKYCCMHLALEAARPTKFSMPALEDANSIQVAITKSTQGLLDGTLDGKTSDQQRAVARRQSTLRTSVRQLGKSKNDPRGLEDRAGRGICHRSGK